MIAMIFLHDKKSNLKDEYEDGNINNIGINEKEYGLKNDNNNYLSSISSNQIWLNKTFKKYYFNYFSNIIIPEKIHLREFGFRQFDGKVIRHLSFINSGELYAYLLKLSPSDIYCSSSVYGNPKESMDKKEWLGSELIFDIDGKDLELDCSIKHNYTKCFQCNFINKGLLKRCGNCNGSKLSVIDIPCKNCIFFLKKEVIKLMNFLTKDFGICSKDISIYFSGNNGFHIHVNDVNYYSLLSIERSEISSYIMGKGFKLESLGIKADKEKKFTIIAKNKQFLDIGWRERISKSIKFNLSSIKSNNNDGLIKHIEKLENIWNCSFQQIVLNTLQDLSVRIDPVVTMDIHRIFRLNGTINSKSGLVKIVCKNIDEFNPFIDACFYEKLKVDIYSKVDITVFFKGRRYEINTGLNHVPEYVAVYLISKGLANINIKET
jgi:DNA primase small subunit